jgi:CDP-diacylglycerol--glycerol-3-phosphate 3-phosphatidyltransferase
MSRNTIFNISNSISIIRIFFAYPVYYYISVQENIIVMILALVAFGTDLLDGFLARKLNQITKFGKIIDPVADKICLAGGLIGLTIYQNFPVWITGVIIGRDILIILGSLVLLIIRKEVNSSNRPGKYTVSAIVAFGIVYLLNMEWLKIPLTVILVVLLLYSLVKYGVESYKQIADKNVQ